MFLDEKKPTHNERALVAWQRVRRLLTLALMIIATLLVGAEVLTGSEANAQQKGFKVVVSADSPLSQIDRDQLSKLFLKRSRKADIQPVDQSESSSVRDDFSKAIHGRSVKAIKSYWLRMIFSGDASAPPELASDQAVLSYVAANRDSIGYVAADVILPPTLKVVTVVD